MKFKESNLVRMEPATGWTLDQVNDWLDTLERNMANALGMSEKIKIKGQIEYFENQKAKLVAHV